MTFQIDIDADISRFENTHKPDSAGPSTGIHSSATIALSLLLHSALFTLIIYFSTQSSVLTDNINKSENRETKPIQATLYFPPIQVAESEITKNSEVQQEPHSAPPENPVSQNEDNQIPELADISSPEDPPQTVTAITLPTPEPSITKGELAEIGDNNDKGSTINSMEKINRALSSHLDQFHQSELNQLSQQAAKQKDQTFYQQQTQGLTYQPQNLQEIPIKKVDCSSSTVEALSRISMLMGGGLRCTEQPDHQKFIDARLNKER